MSKLVRVKEALEILDIPRSNFYRLEKKGYISAKRHPISNYRYYKVEELEKLKELFAEFR